MDFFFFICSINGGKTIRGLLNDPVCGAALVMNAFYFSRIPNISNCPSEMKCFSKFTCCRRKCSPAWTCTVVVCFLWSIEPMRKLGNCGFKEEHASPRAAPHRLHLLSTHKFTDARARSERRWHWQHRTAPFIFSGRECDERSSLETPTDGSSPRARQRWTWKVSALGISCNALL